MISLFIGFDLSRPARLWISANAIYFFLEFYLSRIPQTIAALLNRADSCLGPLVAAPLPWQELDNFPDLLIAAEIEVALVDITHSILQYFDFAL